jgi:hypothetical protein
MASGHVVAGPSTTCRPEKSSPLGVWRCLEYFRRISGEEDITSSVLRIRKMRNGQIESRLKLCGEV